MNTILWEQRHTIVNVLQSEQCHRGTWVMCISYQKCSVTKHSCIGKFHCRKCETQNDKSVPVTTGQLKVRKYIFYMYTDWPEDTLPIYSLFHPYPAFGACKTWIYFLPSVSLDSWEKALCHLQKIWNPNTCQLPNTRLDTLVYQYVQFTINLRLVFFQNAPLSIIIKHTLKKEMFFILNYLSITQFTLTVFNIYILKATTFDFSVQDT